MENANTELATYWSTFGRVAGFWPSDRSSC